MKFLIVLCLLALNLHGRTFTNNKGEKIEASVTEVSMDKVRLALKGGKSYWVEIKSLSRKDQIFVAAWVRAGELGGRRAQEELERRDLGKLEDNYDDDWPRVAGIDTDVLIKTVMEDPSQSRFVYYSPNYEFICDVKLAPFVVKKLAILFETTREFCSLMPISTLKAHRPGALFRNRIYLFGTRQAYVRNGGPPNSGGVYMSRGNKGIVMAPLTSLGVKRKGDRYVHDRNGNNDVMPHELTHQLTDYQYFLPGARGWFSEGLAEYVSTTPYQTGKFMVEGNLFAIKRSVTSRDSKRGRGSNLGRDITAPDLRSYMLQSYGDFTRNGNFNYALGLLLTYYFFHLDDDRTSITKFLKALKAGKTGDAALTELRNGRSWDELEMEVSKAWKAKGINLTFK